MVDVESGERAHRAVPQDPWPWWGAWTGLVLVLAALVIGVGALARGLAFNDGAGIEPSFRLRLSVVAQGAGVIPGLLTLVGLLVSVVDDMVIGVRSDRAARIRPWMVVPAVLITTFVLVVNLLATWSAATDYRLGEGAGEAASVAERLAAACPPAAGALVAALAGAVLLGRVAPLTPMWPARLTAGGREVASGPYQALRGA